MEVAWKAVEMSTEQNWLSTSVRVIKIIDYMGTMPEQYVAEYKESYNKAANRLVREFSNSFCKEDGSIDWEKLVEFNSGDWGLEYIWE